jgi:HlyD family secretion protein
MPPDTSDSRPDGRFSAALRGRGRLFLVLCAVLLLGIAFALWWWLGRSPPLHYVTARVTRGAIQRSVSMTGALNPVVTAQVGSYVSGNIKSWSCDYNTPVKVGQSCAIIDPLPFQVIVDQDEADVRTSRAQLAKDRAAVANAELIYQHDAKLIDQGIVSQETLDTDRSTRDQDRAQVELDLASIADKEAVLHAARVNLAYTNIVSPVDGMVITRYIDVGQTVVSSLQSSTLFLIGKDMRKMQVDTNVSEADVGEVEPGQKATFTVQAYPDRTFVGTVRQIREGPITVQNVVTYDVVVDVPNEDFKLLPGMTADAHIISAERLDVLRVPLPAIRFTPEGFAHQPAAAPERAPGAERSHGSGGGSDAGSGSGEHGHGGAGGHAHAHAGRAGPPARLWVLRDGKLVPVMVHAGLDDGTLVEVSGEDLQEGDVVVVNAVRPGEPRSAGGERPPGGGSANARPQGGAGFIRQ